MQRVLVANRGEIEVRVNRAAHALGLETVQVVSAADRDSMAARIADRVVTIGPAPSKQSYLDPKLIVHAAQATGCDALHPGYGFLSENPALARACEAAGVIFVGPSPDLLELFGDKTRARDAQRVGACPFCREEPLVFELKHPKDVRPYPDG